MYVLLYECVYIRTLSWLRHLYQVEFCSFIVRYPQRGHLCTVGIFLVFFLARNACLAYILQINVHFRKCMPKNFTTPELNNQGGIFYVLKSQGILFQTV